MSCAFNTWATAAIRPRRSRTRHLTCKARFWGVEAARVTTSANKTTSNCRITRACLRASTCSSLAGGCGRNAIPATLIANFNGTFTFNSLDAYQITEQGIAAGLTPAQIRAAGGGAGQFSITYGTPAVVVTYYDVGLYFSDDWRWKPNFTLSYGLRFETQTDIHDNGDLAPRVSFAWGLGKGPTPKTVLRAGWGMFYDRFDEQYVLQADRLNGTTQQQYIVDQPDFFPYVPPQGSPLLNTAKTFPTSYQLAPNLRAAYTMQTAVSVERQITRNATVAISYLNSKGVHQFLTRNINAPLPGTYDPTDPTSGVRPFGSAAGNIYQYESGGEFEQNQLIVNANVKIGSQGIAFRLVHAEQRQC